jgi:hypothetical protein
MGEGILPMITLEHHLGVLPLCFCFHGNTSGLIDQLSFEAFISPNVGISFDSNMTLFNTVKNSFCTKPHYVKQTCRLMANLVNRALQLTLN